MAPFQYQEADSAPGKGKVCISSNFSRICIRGLKKHFIFVIPASVQLSGYPKLNWNGFKFDTGLSYSKKATNSF